MNRIENIRSILELNNIDGMIVTSYHNIYYLSKFTSPDAILLITKKNKYILSDFRYITQIKIECPDYCFKQIIQGDFSTELQKIIEDEKLEKLGFEGDNIIYNQYDEFSKKLSVDLVNINLADLRVCKDSEEVKNIKIANEIALKALDYVVKNVLKAGVSEIEVRNILDSKMKEYGASGTSFDTIVASGIRGALPHGAPSDKLLVNGELVTIDFGCLYKGYCSDITRTFAIGEEPNEKLKEIYDIVHEAQLKGIAAAKPGIKCNEVDKIVRDFIASKGYGDNFGHGLGHGLGILIHEAPRFAPVCDKVLQVGTVITVEPGIYVEGIGGVRIEDDIVITEQGCEVITQYPKELIVIK